MEMSIPPAEGLVKVQAGRVVRQASPARGRRSRKYQGGNQPKEDKMKMRLAMKAVVGLILGSVLIAVPAASAEEYTMYDSFKDLHDRSMMRSGDMYDSMEPTAAGPRGPVRTDMMKSEEAYGSSGSHGYGASYSAYSPWRELKYRMGPIGGEGTN